MDLLSARRHQLNTLLSAHPARHHHRLATHVVQPVLAHPGDDPVNRRFELRSAAESRAELIGQNADSAIGGAVAQRGVDNSICVPSVPVGDLPIGRSLGCGRSTRRLRARHRHANRDNQRRQTNQSVYPRIFTASITSARRLATVRMLCNLPHFLSSTSVSSVCAVLVSSSSWRLTGMTMISVKGTTVASTMPATSVEIPRPRSQAPIAAAAPATARLAC